MALDSEYLWICKSWWSCPASLFVLTVFDGFELSKAHGSKFFKKFQKCSRKKKPTLVHKTLWRFFCKKGMFKKESRSVFSPCRFFGWKNESCLVCWTFPLGTSWHKLAQVGASPYVFRSSFASTLSLPWALLCRRCKSKKLAAYALVTSNDRLQSSAPSSAKQLHVSSKSRNCSNGTPATVR